MNTIKKGQCLTRTPTEATPEPTSMTTEIYDEVRYKDYESISSFFSKVDVSVVSPTKDAIEFYKEQARAKQIFDEIEKTNEEFKEAVRNFTSYPGWYTLSPYYLECLDSLWVERCKENPMLEKDCIHGYNCQKLNNCSCTPDSEVKRNKEIRVEQHRLDHNIKCQPKRTKKQNERLERWNKEREKVENLKWGSY
jgi:hypothetical protein